MKCSSCGREFGSGVNCQYCGVDRVTGLGNYSGYHNLEGDINYSSYDGMSSSPKTMVCFACGEIIPANSEFCPYCSKQLYVTCPKCGNTYSSQFPACNKCGTNRKEYFKEKERIKKDNERKERERLEAERQKAIREEEKRKRRQKEWEQSPAKRFCIIIGIICLLIGVASLFITISEHGSDNFRVNEGKELEGYGMSIVMIIMGGCFLFAEKMD